MINELKNPKILTAFVYDALVASIAFPISVALRHEMLNPFDAPIQKLGMVTAIVVLSQLVCFYLTGLYRGIWRFSSTPDLVRIVKGASAGAILSIVAVFLYNRLETVPRSAFLIDWLLIIMGLGGGRFSYRIWKDSLHEKRTFRQLEGKRERVLIVGAGSSGNQLAKEILVNPTMGLEVVGFIDDSKLKKNRLLNGIKILGPVEEIPKWVEQLEVDKIFIALPSATGEEMKGISHHCTEAGVDFKTLPGIGNILGDKVELSILRHVKMEDLLGRKPVSLDQDSIRKMVSGNIVLVTGAGGSIGSEICRQISLFSPDQIIMVDVSELYLFELENEFRDVFPDIKIVPYIADVKDKDRMRGVFETHRPQIVLHAAAYKHVPLMEKNPIEAIKTNIGGIVNVAELALSYEVEKFVMISTDKAVNPTNVMGATKRVAEMVCKNAMNTHQNTQFITVRFGNVLGSNGSVIPVFRKCIEEGKDVPVTHPDIERYFMSIPEACQLVLQAATMGEGGEIFVLDMGKPVKIIDLAKEMISLAGLELGRDINIKIVGLRPGEKLYEELFSSDEELMKTLHEKVRISDSRNLPELFEQQIKVLLDLPGNSDFPKIINLLRRIVPEFVPTDESRPSSDQNSIH